jgi:hypothetical protein
MNSNTTASVSDELARRSEMSRRSNFDTAVSLLEWVRRVATGIWAIDVPQNPSALRSALVLDVQHRLLHRDRPERGEFLNGSTDRATRNPWHVSELGRIMSAARERERPAPP